LHNSIGRSLRHWFRVSFPTLSPSRSSRRRCGNARMFLSSFVCCFFFVPSPARYVSLDFGKHLTLMRERGLTGDLAKIELETSSLLFSSSTVAFLAVRRKWGPLEARIEGALPEVARKSARNAQGRPGSPLPARDVSIFDFRKRRKRSRASQRICRCQSRRKMAAVTINLIDMLTTGCFKWSCPTSLWKRHESKKQEFF
jgi:hypothetical protein